MAKFSEAFKKYDPKTQSKWYKWEDSDIEFLIAPLRNPFQQKLMTKTFTNDELHKIEEGGFAKAFETDVLAVAYEKMHSINGESLVFDWKNVTDDEGKDIPFTHKKIVELMIEDNKLGAWIQTKSLDLFVERTQELEEKTKN